MDNFDAWFSVFVAGEGCFYIESSIGLIIRLRLDDVDILNQIQQRFGGSVCVTGNICYWRSGAKIETLLRIVNVFDANPLRAKKHNDYLIWREAVIEKRDGVASTTSTNKIRIRLIKSRRQK